MHIEYTAEQMAIQPKLLAANINPESFLATDYLNHFNEIVMLLEMIPDMPELIEDTEDWAPKTYIQHFEDSGFQAKGLAISAFELAPNPVRVALDHICGELNQTISTTLLGLSKLNVIERGLSPAARELIKQRVATIQNLLMQLNEVVHGKFDGNALLSTAAVKTKTDAKAKPAQTEDVQTQDDIDKLFD